MGLLLYPLLNLRGYCCFTMLIDSLSNFCPQFIRWFKNLTNNVYAYYSNMPRIFYSYLKNNYFSNTRPNMQTLEMDDISVHDRIGQNLLTLGC